MLRMGNFGNRVNFQLSVFDEFTRFGGLVNPKNKKLAWSPGIR